MKKKYLYLLVAALISAPVFTSCSEDDDNSVNNTITFEAAELPETGFINNASYTEAGYVFSNFYDEKYSSWNGFAVSNNVDKETAGYMNQYSVYADCGAKKSKNFAVAYYSEYNAYSDDQFPEISREDKKYFNLNSAELCLTTYTYLSIMNGDAYAKKFEHGDYYEVIFSGVTSDGDPIYDSKTKEPIEVVVPVVDFRDDKSVIFDKWTKVDLSVLKGVDAVRISARSSDTAYGFMNTPAYIAIDNLNFTMYPDQKILQVE